MPYKRTCVLCRKTQTLVGEPRSVICAKCRCSKIGIRSGTGRKDRGNTCGYRMIYVDGIRMYEHRHVMEVSLGRRLRRNEHVHHLDGNKINNHISNLELISPSEHARKHFTTEIATKLSVLAHQK